PLPGLRQAEALVRDAVREGVPTLGHCLGGQLMARALGAPVGASPAPEIGWQALHVHDTPEAAAWFGAPGPQVVFHWHFDAFELPPGAVRLAGSAACPNQAFALGPHLAMQFHMEVDEEKLHRWSLEEGERWAAARSRHATAQSGPQMRDGVALHLPAQQALADRVYWRWLELAAAR
ncbi:MAG TPA: type 1 glutamine amidotransferase, partial [Rubrivivax sp.]|nr:type 1 glutamine amidotransferase [Rubrivivax sp.]